MIKLKKILGLNKKISRTGDLIPTGIKYTIKSNTHGNGEDFNDVWEHIYNEMKKINTCPKN